MNAMKTLYSGALLLAGAALAGCETTVALPEPPHTPRVALMYTLTPTPQDSSFLELYQERQLYVSNSQRVFERGELQGRPDARVELRNAAGSVVERYRPVAARNSASNGQPGSYRPVLGFRPQPGQAYTLRAELPGLEPAESTLTMPVPAVVESGTYTPRAAGPNSSESLGRLNVVLRDDPAGPNYYLAYARVLDQQGQPGPWSTVDVDYDSQRNVVGIGQFLLSSPQRQYDIYPFADTDVNGKQFTLVADVRFYQNCFQGQGSPCPQAGFIEVHVSSITADAYQFYLSRRRYFDSDDNPFAEPAPLASNVRPGYGLFAGATDVTYRIRL